MEDIVFKKCSKCGNLVKIIGPLRCESIACCQERMQTLVENEDGNPEKHLPNYEIKDGKLIVTVNHVMEDDHFIEWICFQTDKKEEFFYPEKEAKAIFDYDKGKIYVYCNKHGLWKQEV